jgi:hypothetical protein
VSVHFIIDIHPEEFLISGTIQQVAVEGDSPSSHPVLTFESQTFTWAFARLAEFLQGAPEAGATLVRRMGPNEAGHEYPLDTELLQLLRVDPLRAIRSLQPETRRVVLPRLPPEATIATRLQSGVDTLARALSDVVWLRRRADLVESPFTGRWVPYKTTQLDQAGSPLLDLSVPPPHAATDAWVPVLLATLLATNAPRFYLPALCQGWVLRGDLETHYQSYLVNKETACNTIYTPQ